MKSHFLFKEFIWLVNLLHCRKRMRLCDINREWLSTDMSEGIDLARNTFLRHKNAIQDIFGLIIECDPRDEYRYYLRNAHVLSEDSIQRWMLSTITVSTMLTENMSLSDRILLESVPSEGNFLHTIIGAMKRKVRISVKYQKYGHDDYSNVTFAPYCLRLFQCRWYVLGQFQRPAREGETIKRRKGLTKGYIEYFATFSLDRVKEIKVTDEKFEMDKDFCAIDFFNDSFGVYREEKTPVQNIVIRAYGLQRYYMRDLPWHHSQKLKSWCKEYADYEYTLRPTDDFIRYIMRYGKLVKVISPLDVARKVRKQLLEAADVYADIDDSENSNVKE